MLLIFILSSISNRVIINGFQDLWELTFALGLPQTIRLLLSLMLAITIYIYIHTLYVYIYTQYTYIYTGYIYACYCMVITYIKWSTCKKLWQHCSKSSENSSLVVLIPCHHSQILHFQIYHLDFHRLFICLQIRWRIVKSES